MAMKTRFKLLALLGLCASLTLAGCGRKGGLDDPGAPAPEAGAAMDPALAAPVETPPRSDRPFPLDFLIR
jgi:predicted small lipoprotein YifL